MLKIGERQILKVIRIKDFGAYLAEESDKEKDVLLPKKYVPENVSLGDELEVFIYRDSDDRIVATTRKPFITMGELKQLTVKDVTGIGAFLDWGLEKDLFMPFKEQIGKVQKGDRPLVALYIDKSGRLCCTMKVAKYLSDESPYHEDDYFQGVVYSINPNMGAFVAVDNKYNGMIPIHKAPGGVKAGDFVRGRILHVREDGKLELTTQEKISIQMDLDAAKLVRIMDEHFGRLPVTEKDGPDSIMEATGLSKAAFKRAVGRLLKSKVITIENGVISRSEE